MTQFNLSCECQKCSTLREWGSGQAILCGNTMSMLLYCKTCNLKQWHDTILGIEEPIDDNG